MGEKLAIAIVMGLFVVEILLVYMFPKLFRYKRETVIGISVLAIIILAGIGIVL